ncbi:MAG: Minf_1886 family protein [Planctomycetota bacterium]
MTTPLQAMRKLLKEDDRYKIEAYQFIREALQYANENSIGFAETKSHDDGGETATRHVSGQQLCQACREYAVEQYGFLAKMVLGSWGIRSTSDLGDLVYNLIKIGQMRKSENDRREDFNDVFEFDSAFEPQFELVPIDEE